MPWEANIEGHRVVVTVENGVYPLYKLYVDGDVRDRFQSDAYAKDCTTVELFRFQVGQRLRAFQWQILATA
jgi:hypothetical protein